MAMSTFVYYQFYVFLATFYGGIVIAFIYDIYRVLRRVFNPSKLATIIQDLFFWFVVTVIAISVLLYSNEGILRWYTFLGFGLGAIIYNALLSNFIQRALLKGIEYFKRAAKFLIRGIKYPFKFVASVYFRIRNKCVAFLRPYYLRFKRLATLPKRVFKDIKKYSKTILTKK